MAGQIDGDDAETLREGLDLLGPEGRAAGPAMDKQQMRTGAAMDGVADRGAVRRPRLAPQHGGDGAPAASIPFSARRHASISVLE